MYTGAIIPTCRTFVGIRDIKITFIRRVGCAKHYCTSYIIEQPTEMGTVPIIHIRKLRHAQFT